MIKSQTGQGNIQSILLIHFIEARVQLFIITTNTLNSANNKVIPEKQKLRAVQCTKLLLCAGSREGPDTRFYYTQP